MKNVKRSREEEKRKDTQTDKEKERKKRKVWFCMEYTRHEKVNEAVK